ncbi:amino acid ABC transporter substrate-binding protein [Rhizobium sp. FY34]|uniref:amino acid ABC transporter substrate-binding protein n=1 Tax=Rhizobium sp. FY34 TaxID=2562309 RepID=UPI001FEF14C2|nr:amino acid ABC transporter substrate-binding protein [Rhizobium sp. FY34]
MPSHFFRQPDRVIRSMAKPQCNGLALFLGLAASLSWPMAGMAQEPVDTLGKIARTKTVTIGHRTTELPFSYVVDGKPTGYSIELCQKIIERLSQKLGLDAVTIDYVPVTAATRFVMMRAGKIDMECAATTNNAERRKLVEFSYPHFVTATRYVSKTSEGLHTIADLAGRSVAATTGTVNLEQLNALNRSRGLNISVLLNKGHDDAFGMVETGKASAFVMDDILLAGLVASSARPTDFAISDEPLSPPEPYGIMMPLGDMAFKSEVNAILRQIYTSREIDGIYDRWFQSPVPPAGLSMKLPMSPELKAVFADPKDIGN